MITLIRIADFTTQELKDLLAAIADAQEELCVGEGFPEATAYDERLDDLAEKIRASLHASI